MFKRNTRTVDLRRVGPAEPAQLVGALRDLGLSDQQIADEMNVHRSTIRRLHAGEHQVNPDTAEKAGRLVEATIARTLDEIARLGLNDALPATIAAAVRKRIAPQVAALVAAWGPRSADTVADVFQFFPAIIPSVKLADLDLDSPTSDELVREVAELSSSEPEALAELCRFADRVDGEIQVKDGGKVDVARAAAALVAACGDSPSGKITTKEARAHLTAILRHRRDTCKG